MSLNQIGDVVAMIVVKKVMGWIQNLIFCDFSAKYHFQYPVQCEILKLAKGEIIHM